EAPLRFLLVDGRPEVTGRHGFLVMTWFHSLMDPQGAENLLTQLVDCDADDDGLQGGPSSAFTVARDLRPLRERARLGRQNLEYMRALVTTPPVSLGSTVTAFGPARFWQGAFVEQDPDVNGKRAARDICWRLALVGKALSALWEQRRLPDVPYVVPI